MGCRSNGLSIYPSSYFIWFFPKKLFWFWILKKKNWLDRREKNYSDLTFSQYNHIQNFEEKKLFQHFANLIKIRSTHLIAPYLDLIIPPFPEGGGGILFYLCLSVRPSKIFFVTFFSATIDGQKSDIWSEASHRYAISWEVGSVFGTIRFLLPVCQFSWFLSTLNIYAQFSQQLLMAEIWYLVTSFI